VRNRRLWRIGPPLSLATSAVEATTAPGLRVSSMRRLRAERASTALSVRMTITAGLRSQGIQKPPRERSTRVRARHTPEALCAGLWRGAEDLGAGGAPVGVAADEDGVEPAIGVEQAACSTGFEHIGPEGALTPESVSDPGPCARAGPWQPQASRGCRGDGGLAPPLMASEEAQSVGEAAPCRSSASYSVTAISISIETTARKRARSHTRSIRRQSASPGASRPIFCNRAV